MTEFKQWCLQVIRQVGENRTADADIGVLQEQTWTQD
jgi:hypothetical protein